MNAQNIVEEVVVDAQTETEIAIDEIEAAPVSTRGPLIPVFVVAASEKYNGYFFQNTSTGLLVAEADALNAKGKVLKGIARIEFASRFALALGIKGQFVAIPEGGNVGQPSLTAQFLGLGVTEMRPAFGTDSDRARRASPEWAFRKRYDTGRVDAEGKPVYNHGYNLGIRLHRTGNGAVSRMPVSIHIGLSDLLTVIRGKTSDICTLVVAPLTAPEGGTLIENGATIRAKAVLHCAFNYFSGNAPGKDEHGKTYDTVNRLQDEDLLLARAGVAHAGANGFGQARPFDFISMERLAAKAFPGVTFEAIKERARTQRVRQARGKGLNLDAAIEL